MKFELIKGYLYNLYAVISVKSEGNTTIRISTRGTSYGTEWSVFPYLNPDPTLQGLTSQQREREEELRVTGIRKPGEDSADSEMDKEIAGAIAHLNHIIASEGYKDLGMVVDQIDVDPEGKIAKILERGHSIKSIEGIPQSQPEVKG